MTQISRPIIEIMPEKPVARRDRATEMTVLIRITAPKLAPTAKRPKLNLSLVLDRSGSMSGEKLDAVKKAAIYAIQQLEETDRVSVVAYGSDIETIIAPTFVRDKRALTAQIEAIEVAGCTALHAGWLEGASHVAAHLEKNSLNRVLLLTDGLANEGETHPQRIADDVKGLATRGVSTSTLGVGDDFNEDLLQLMARVGDGNYYFIEGAANLERIFAAELSGLMSTTGRKVSLGLEPQNGAKIIEVLSKLDRNELGRLQLSNLIAGNTIEVAFRMRVPALQQATDVLFCRLAYDAPETAERQVIREALSLSPCDERQWNETRADERVESVAARLEIAKQRDLIAQSLDSGDVGTARLAVTRGRQQAAAAPLSPAQMQEELAEFDAVESSLAEGNTARASKQSKYASYRRNQSRD